MDDDRRYDDDYDDVNIMLYFEKRYNIILFTTIYITQHGPKYILLSFPV